MATECKRTKDMRWIRFSDGYWTSIGNVTLLTGMQFDARG